MIMTQNLLANSWIMVLVVLWVLPWKGVALWKAAQKNDKWWFIALLILNTLGILEIIYIYIFSKRQIKSKAEVVKVEK